MDRGSLDRASLRGQLAAVSVASGSQQSIPQVGKLSLVWVAIKTSIKDNKLSSYIGEYVLHGSKILFRE